MYLIAILFLPLALIYPYHFAFISLALGGVLHIFAEMTYFTREKKILRKRQSFPPIIVLGAVFLTAIGIGWYLRGLGVESNFGLIDDSRSVSSFVTNFYYRAFYIIIGIYVVVSIYPVLTRYGNKILPILGLMIAIGGILGSIYPVAFAFALVHGHNLVPWVFLGRDKGKRFYLHGFLVSILIPICGVLLFSWSEWGISEQALSMELETDLFRHVVPILSPFSPELLLLSFFGYSQAIHYILWIFYIPSGNLQERFTGFLSEVSFFLGYSKVKMLYGFAFVGLLFVLSSLFFVYYPLEWRRLYFVVSAGHVFVELPLVVLAFFPRT